jgi:ABC-type transport system involved in cytochrome bd biosynthesis fused ATPase/permease subunit
MAEHFRIIAIRPLQPTLQDGRVIHMEKVQSIQKALFDKTDWLYFYRGITIDQEQGRISMTKEALADYSLYDLKNLKVSVSAIVGKNGAGKSSAVDLIIRMINNL